MTGRHRDLTEPFVMRDGQLRVRPGWGADRHHVDPVVQERVHVGEVRVDAELA